LISQNISHLTFSPLSSTRVCENCNVELVSASKVLQIAQKADSETISETSSGQGSE